MWWNPTHGIIRDLIGREKGARTLRIYIMPLVGTIFTLSMVVDQTKFIIYSGTNFGGGSSYITIAELKKIKISRTSEKEKLRSRS